MFTCVLGVIRIRYCVCVVFAVSVLVESVTGIDVPVGLVTDPYTTVPASLVISRSDVEEASFIDTVTALTTSVRDDVCRVNAST
jgi:hypothetical protein